ncbi:transferase [Streptomyces corynorhini]|uniref:Transferase n=1 Tax=Streptomyces corynorhini TaxID=2282652 RepID=A0A370BAB2_9ACTN|nr:transferase [Streptomyces corynorhini]RDG37329.1 transferase [Streptomyces corynorhini]
MSQDRSETPRADCLVDEEGRLTATVRLPGAAHPGLLLRPRPKKGGPQEPGHRLELRPLAEHHWRAVLEPAPLLAEGRWDAYLLEGPGDEGERLRPGLLDLRALQRGRTPGRTPTPLAVRVPYTTRDGFLAVRTWLRAPHAEVDALRVRDDAMTVRGRLFGARLADGATVRLVRRGADRAVRESPLHHDGGHGFSLTADYRDLLDERGTGGGGRPAYWDLHLHLAPDGPRARVGRLLDDVAERKSVFVYPSTDLDGTPVRPYYTVDNDLAVVVGGA